MHGFPIVKAGLCFHSDELPKPSGRQKSAPEPEKGGGPFREVLGSSERETREEPGVVRDLAGASKFTNPVFSGTFHRRVLIRVFTTFPTKL